LPEIVVCGEQSSGKSLVLEAILGVIFPSKDSLCTRFATELILCWRLIRPIKIRLEAAKQKLLAFEALILVEDLMIEDLIKAAKDVVGINDSTKIFSLDILWLEILGPE
jgi:hypothetical protein